MVPSAFEITPRVWASQPAIEAIVSSTFAPVSFGTRTPSTVCLGRSLARSGSSTHGQPQVPLNPRDMGLRNWPTTWDST